MSQLSTNTHDKILFPMRLNLQEIQMNLLRGKTNIPLTLCAFYDEAVQVLTFLRNQKKEHPHGMCCAAVTLSVITSLRHYIYTGDEVVYDMTSLYIKGHFWASNENHTTGRALDDKLAQLRVLARVHVKAMRQVEQDIDTQSNKVLKASSEQGVTLLEKCHIDLPPTSRSVQSISKEHHAPVAQGSLKEIPGSGFCGHENLGHTVTLAHGTPDNCDDDHGYEADNDDDVSSFDIPNSIAVLPAVEILSVSEHHDVTMDIDSRVYDRASNQNRDGEQRRNKHQESYIRRTKSVFPIPPRKNTANAPERSNDAKNLNVHDRISRASRHALKMIMQRQFDEQGSRIIAAFASRKSMREEMGEKGDEENIRRKRS